MTFLSSVFFIWLWIIYFSINSLVFSRNLQIQSNIWANTCDITYSKGKDNLYKFKKDGRNNAVKMGGDVKIFNNYYPIIFSLNLDPEKFIQTQDPIDLCKELIVYANFHHSVIKNLEFQLSHDFPNKINSLFMSVGSLNHKISYEYDLNQNKLDSIRLVNVFQILDSRNYIQLNHIYKVGGNYEFIVSGNFSQKKSKYFKNMKENNYKNNTNETTNLCNLQTSFHLFKKVNGKLKLNKVLLKLLFNKNKDLITTIFDISSRKIDHEFLHTFSNGNIISVILKNFKDFYLNVSLGNKDPWIISLGSSFNDFREKGIISVRKNIMWTHQFSR